MAQPIVSRLTRYLTKIISETNGINLDDTLELLGNATYVNEDPEAQSLLREFRSLVFSYQANLVDMNQLLKHPVAEGFFHFFKNFPLPYRDEHTHLTGALSEEFILPRLKRLLEGPHRKVYEEKIKAVYGPDSFPIETEEDIRNLIRLKEGERFHRYLSILMLPKLLLTDRQAHVDAAYHMAKELFEKFNVGFIRLKFTLSRASTRSTDQIPGTENITEEDVVLGLYEGLMNFKKEQPQFDFVLSPSFRKEADFFDAGGFQTKRDHFIHQVDSLLRIIEKYPELTPYLCEVDTVGDERELYRKTHFMDMKYGLRKLHYKGFKIRSHHGEIWTTLRRGIQAVDNAMNIWHIDTLEHGLSLGINPNFYFHSFLQRVLKWNKNKEAVREGSPEYFEIQDMEWNEHTGIRDKLINGTPLNKEEVVLFTKTKFHTAREIEHYQHDVLNRMIHKNVSLVALPSSNNKLTECFEDYKDHPFTWWEKKGVGLGVGTDNYVTLDTNFIQELLILLFTDPQGLKITKLLMVATGESRRPFISHLLWKMRSRLKESQA